MKPRRPAKKTKQKTYGPRCIAFHRKTGLRCRGRIVRLCLCRKHARGFTGFMASFQTEEFRLQMAYGQWSNISEADACGER